MCATKGEAPKLKLHFTVQRWLPAASFSYCHVFLFPIHFDSY